MKVLVAGVKGRREYDVVRELSFRNHIGIGGDIEDMDITNAERVRKIIAKGTENITKVCKELNISMMYLSTDYAKQPLNVCG